MRLPSWHRAPKSRVMVHINFWCQPLSVCWWVSHLHTASPFEENETPHFWGNFSSRREWVCIWLVNERDRPRFALINFFRVNLSAFLWCWLHSTRSLMRMAIKMCVASVSGFMWVSECLMGVWWAREETAHPPLIRGAINHSKPHFNHSIIIIDDTSIHPSNERVRGKDANEQMIISSSLYPKHALHGDAETSKGLVGWLMIGQTTRKKGAMFFIYMSVCVCVSLQSIMQHAK